MGVTDSDWKMLAMQALMAMDLEVKKSMSAASKACQQLVRHVCSCLEDACHESAYVAMDLEVLTLLALIVQRCKY
jgi:hypothetical protein